MTINTVQRYKLTKPTALWIVRKTFKHVNKESLLYKSYICMTTLWVLWLVLESSPTKEDCYYLEIKPFECREKSCHLITWSSSNMQLQTHTLQNS